MPKVSYSVDQQNDFLEKISKFYEKDVLTSNEIREFSEEKSLPFPHFIFRDKNRKLARNCYSVAMATANVSKLSNLSMAPLPQMQKKPISQHKENYTLPSMQADVSCTVPEKDPTYIPFGNYDDIETIIKSKVFFPVYLTGNSGNGKTMSIIQACAKLKRELLRINVTEETDELDLIGGTELVDGNTVNREGAVILAMRRGSVLLIDEGDLNNGKIMCLMPILEGKPYFNKKTGEVIQPTLGFNIFITGNTKGKGSEDGRFIGTKVMNEAFLERFAVTMEQEYPSASIEKKILIKNMELLGNVDEDFAGKLATWSEIIRKTFDDGGVDDLITTRRLVHIVKSYSIFKDRVKSITLALNRFDSEIKTGFLDTYMKLDESVNPQSVIVDDPFARHVPPTFNTRIDPNTGNMIVESHGQVTEFSAHEFSSSILSESEIINNIVADHAAKANVAQPWNAPQF